MPLIGRGYYANPAFGRMMEQAREREASDEAERADRGRVHHIHIQRHPDGIKVEVHRYGPASDDDRYAPSGEWSTHNFAHDDHEKVGEFVRRALSHGRHAPEAD